MEVKSYRREVAKVVRERAEVVDTCWEVAVFKRQRLTLSRTVLKIVKDWV